MALQTLLINFLISIKRLIQATHIYVWPSLLKQSFPNKLNTNNMSQTNTMSNEFKYLLDHNGFTERLQYFTAIIKHKASRKTERKQIADEMFLAMEVEERKCFVVHLVDTEEADFAQHFIWLI